MTENTAKKNDVRRRMAETGERCKVARRSGETASGSGSHLIGDEETRRIAESFLTGLGLLDQDLALDLRRPQDYFHRIWNTAFRASDLAEAGEDIGVAELAGDQA